MRKHQGPLTSGFVRTVETPGRYGDGRGSDGLSLLVRITATGYLSKTYQQRLYIDRKATMMGLGNTRQLSLTEARSKAKRNATAIEKGDPTPRRRSNMKPIFKQVAETYIDFHAPSWKNTDKDARAWRQCLADYAYPVFGSMVIDRIKPAHVLDAVGPHWHTKNATMKKLLQRVSIIFDLAAVEGHVKANPVDPVGAALPKNGDKVAHRPALNHANVGAALRTIQDGAGHIDAVQCLEFLTLTACRNGEARGATWEEIDLEARTWLIPGSRMKAKQDHRIPLSDDALAVLMQARERHGESGLVFRGVRGGKLADKRLSELLSGYDGTPHGMRSAYRNWCAENNVPREIAESGLAHVVAGVEGAYLTSDLFTRRRAVMQKWGKYVTAA